MYENSTCHKIFFERYLLLLCIFKILCIELPYKKFFTKITCIKSGDVILVL